MSDMMSIVAMMVAIMHEKNTMKNTKRKKDMKNTTKKMNTKKIMGNMGMMTMDTNMNTNMGHFMIKQ